MRFYSSYSKIRREKGGKKNKQKKDTFTLNFERKFMIMIQLRLLHFLTGNILIR